MKLADLLKSPNVVAALAAIKGALTPQVIAGLPEAERPLADRLVSLNFLPAAGAEEAEAGPAAFDAAVTALAEATRLSADLASRLKGAEASVNKLADLESKIGAGEYVAKAAAELAAQAAVTAAVTAERDRTTRHQARRDEMTTCGLPVSEALLDVEAAAYAGAITSAKARLAKATELGVKTLDVSLCYGPEEVWTAAIKLAEDSRDRQRGGRAVQPLAGGAPGAGKGRPLA